MTGSLDWLHTLADSTRVRLLAILIREELSVGEMCAIVQLPQSTVSRHLKVLIADGWIANRREGTNQMYSSSQADWHIDRQQLWQWVCNQHQRSSTIDHDLSRMQQILAERSRSEAFFRSSADQWDKMRIQLFGARLDSYVLAATMPQESVVAELGCGSAPIAQLVAPYVQRVVAIDNSPAMLTAARQRIGDSTNVRFEQASLTELPVEDETFDVAWLVLVLPYVREPIELLQEAARILKPAKSLVIVDLLPHDRQAYRQEMGHVRLGIASAELNEWLAETGLTVASYHHLPPDRDAMGPALFAAVCRKN